MDKEKQKKQYKYFYLYEWRRPKNPKWWQRLLGVMEPVEIGRFKVEVFEDEDVVKKEDEAMTKTVVSLKHMQEKCGHKFTADGDPGGGSGGNKIN